MSNILINSSKRYKMVSMKELIKSNVSTLSFIEPNHAPQTISESELVQTKSSAKHNDDYMTKRWLFWVVFIFNLIAIMYFTISSKWLKCIKVVGVSMQPTINASVIDDKDEIHCDFVYYSPLVKTKLNGVVVIENTNKAYVNDDDINFLIKRVVATENQKVQFILNEDNVVNGEFYDNHVNYSILVYDASGSVINSSELYDGGDMWYSLTEIERFSLNYPLFNEIFSAVMDISNGTYTYTVPNGCVFVMGDNRNNSLDSRFFGAVKLDDVRGTVVSQISYGTNFYKFWTSLFTFSALKLKFIY